MTIGARIRVLRTRNNLTQQALAERTGLSRLQIVKIEAGYRKVSSVELNFFADALDVSPEDLLVDNARPQYRTNSPESPAVQATLEWFREYLADSARMRRMVKLNAPDDAKPNSVLEKQVRASAQAVRQRLGLGHGRVDPIEALRSLGVQVVQHRVSDPGDASVDGIYWIYDGTPSVFLNTKKDYRRQRFTAAHELGHHELDQGLSETVVDTNVFDLGNDRRHEEKNWFAGAFLIDEHGARELQANKLYDEELVAATMAYFDVSLPAAARELEVLNLLPTQRKEDILARWRQKTLTAGALLARYHYPSPDGRSGNEEFDPTYLAAVKQRYESGALNLTAVARALRMSESDASDWLARVQASEPPTFDEADSLALLGIVEAER
jgi:Zn-dependent peptidase ImmA (M78 family)/DNA-binding XRE family transcriptional regulator